MIPEQVPWRAERGDTSSRIADLAFPKAESIAWPTLHNDTPRVPGAVDQALKRICCDIRLTPVLEMRFLEIARGLKYEDITRRHGISINTVKTEARILYRSIGVRCRHEVEGAVEAATSRAEAGATVGELYGFLRLRFE